VRADCRNCKKRGKRSSEIHTLSTWAQKRTNRLTLLGDSFAYFVDLAGKLPDV
jgi:hypothetical protein